QLTPPEFGEDLAESLPEPCLVEVGGPGRRGGLVVPQRGGEALVDLVAELLADVLQRPRGLVGADRALEGETQRCRGEAGLRQGVIATHASAPLIGSRAVASARSSASSRTETFNSRARSSLEPGFSPATR